MAGMDRIRAKGVFSLLSLPAVIALLAALTVICVGGWQIRLTRQAMLRDARQNLQSLARSLAQHAGRTIEAVDLALVGVVEHAETASMTTGLPHYLAQRSQMLTQARNFVVVGPDGRWLADAAPTHGMLSSADRDYFAWHRDHEASGLHVGDMIVGRTTGLRGISLSRRINAPDGSFDGLTVATLAPEYFERFYKSINMGPHGAIGLWTDDGRLLLRFPAVPSGAALSQAVPQEAAASAFRTRSGVNQSRSPWDGIERLFAFEHVDGLPLVVSAAASIDDLLADWHRDALIEMVVIGGAALALVSLGLGLEVHRHRIRVLHAASREADRRYRLLTENSHDLIALKPSFGQRAYVSPSSRTVVGWEPHELIALTPDAFVHPDDLSRVQADYEALTADCPVATNMHRVKHKAGHYIWVEAVFRRAEDGSVLVSARDVTERRAAECALADSEGRFRSLADTSSDMIQLLDLDGRRRYVSPAALEIFGRDPAEMMGTHPVDFIHPDDADRVRALITGVATGQNDRARSVHRIHHKAGNWVWVDVQFRLVRDSETGAPVEVVSQVRDVAEREAMRHRLEETNRLLRLAEEIAQMGHWRFDPPGGTLTWSEEVYRIHDLDPAVFHPSVDTAIGVYHPHDRAHVEQCFSRALKERHGYEFRARVLRPNGDVRHVLSRGLCEVDPAGEVTAVFGTIMDVTELRRAEVSAMESEARYRILADNTTDMITHMDLTGRRLFVSPGSRELLGYEPQELVDTSPHEMIHPDDAVQLKRVFADLEAGRVPRAVNVNRLRHKDRHWVWVEASLKVVRDAGGQPTGFVGSIRNIMDRKLADEALLASEARYRALAETTTDVITQLDLSMRRRFVSPACRHVLGFEPQEMLGRQPSATIHPDDANVVRALAARLVAGEIEGGRAVTTYRMQHKAGHWVWVEAGINLVRDDVTGMPMSLICSLRDVTERQRAARHLERARAAAEQASRMKADFIANMSHELRTPLTGILGVHDLLREDPRLSADQRRLVGLASGAGTSLLAIVNDVLDFSKIEAGQLSLESVPFDLDDLVAGCRDLAAKGLGSKPIEIRTLLHPTAPRRLVGDPTRLRQILLNLLTNAVKFTERGEIVVAVAYAFERHTLRIDVTDTGIGIPPDRAAQLFDRFTQADSSMTRRFGGTGLGLAICKRLAELMKGEIGVEPTPEGGSRFWFAIPLSIYDRVMDESAKALIDGPAGTRRRLLLAEDHDVNAEIISAMLTARGHRVTVVTNGAAALDAVRTEPAFDLVLMDIQMPVMDGISATVAIRHHQASCRGRRTPIVGLTANAMAEDAAACLAAGMDAHIAKPVVWADLFGTVDRLIDSGSPPPVTADEDALDETALNDLADAIGKDKLATVLERFVADVPARLDIMAGADDLVRAGHAHMLGSAAGQLGFARLSALCRAFECDVAEGRTPGGFAELGQVARRAADLIAASDFLVRA